MTTLITVLTTLSRLGCRGARPSAWSSCSTTPRLSAQTFSSHARPCSKSSRGRRWTHSTRTSAPPRRLELLPLVQVLAEDREKLGRAEKAAAEKFTRFFDLLDEIKERHQLARVLEDEVAKLVVPSLQRFTQKMREEFSKNIRNCSEHSLGTVRVQAGLQAGTCSSKAVIAELTGGCEWGVVLRGALREP
ncbi:hypothetical protein EDB92DRAFT_1950078 [Lactarius akahatsu]|uniref:Uncharacterized protein n=1 Tax=Lactarius akahatsu TaxID=416441 RepID=A0AAD4LEF4_9AGAM|nr:hypothetical protein EDB92DRAFT_1950078 [Lactarius akahatsu]